MGMAGSLTHDIGVNRRASFTGLWVLLAASTMVFAAFSSAFVVRRGLSDDWATMHKPSILFVNTAVLLASSLVMDQSRRALKRGDRTGFNWWWTGATGLGILFLVGEGIAWYQLKQAGVYVSTNPSSSFFYVFTAAHAFHLMGGVAALVYVDVQALRLRLGPAKRTAIDVTAIFWHFLDGIWLYLMIL